MTVWLENRLEKLTIYIFKKSSQSKCMWNNFCKHVCTLLNWISKLHKRYDKDWLTKLKFDNWLDRSEKYLLEFKSFIVIMI